MSHQHHVDRILPKTAALDRAVSHGAKLIDELRSAVEVHHEMAGLRVEVPGAPLKNDGDGGGMLILAGAAGEFRRRIREFVEKTQRELSEIDREANR